VRPRRQSRRPLAASEPAPVVCCLVLTLDSLARFLVKHKGSGPDLRADRRLFPGRAGSGLNRAGSPRTSGSTATLAGVDTPARRQRDAAGTGQGKVLEKLVWHDSRSSSAAV